MASVYTEEHEIFRDTVRAFLTKEVVPQYADWERAGHPPRELWFRAGELGILGIQVPPEYGGSGVASFKFNAIISEELQRLAVPLGGIRVHMDMVLPYLMRYCTPEQKERFLPGVATGAIPLAIAMTEPGAGSDLAGISTSAVRDGDDYVINGSKTMISNGITAELFVVVVKTDPVQRHKGLSLLLVEGDRPGLERGRNLEKIGLHAQETVELFFNDLRVPAVNLLGEEGQGFAYLTSNLPQERLSIAVSSQAAAAAALDATVEYVKERHAFGTTISAFQNTKFELAACATDVRAGQALVECALDAHDRGELTVADSAMTKLYCTEMQGRVVDRCLQLFGGYGYLHEYPIARWYADARVSRIYGGSSEVMKTIVAKSLGL